MTQASPKSSDAPRLSVIVPAYNEAERIGPTLERVEAYLRDQPFAAETIVVDDGSRDATVEVARSSWTGPGLRVIQQPRNQGKGAAIRRAMAEARGEWRLFTDADNSTPIDELDKFWPRAEAGVDVLIASRALRESRLELHQPFYREMMGRTFNVFVRLLVLGDVHDTQCGFKLFSRRAAEAVFPRLRLSGWAFDVECLTIARGLGFRIEEVPVRWINSPATRVNALSDSIQMFGNLLKLRRLYGKDGRRVTPD